MSEHVESETVIVQTEDGQPVDVAELAHLLGSGGEEGAAQILDGEGNVITISADQLAAAGIDLTNLGDEQLQALLQLAAASSETVEPRKRSPAAAAMGDEDELPSKRMKGEPESPSSSAGKKMAAQQGFALIGQEVDVKKDGKMLPATVKYHKRGDGYKVQFEDGRFEWVGQDQILPRGRAADHEYLTIKSANGVAAKRPSAPGTSMQGLDAAMKIQGIESGVKAHGMDPGLKMPGIKVTPSQHQQALGAQQHSHHHHQGHSKTAVAEQSFVCPVCDKKVVNKEPAFIVIRLPACDQCADSKILVLDDEAKKQF